MVEDLTIDLAAFPSLKPEASVKHLLALCASNVRALRLVGTGAMTVSFRGFQRLQSIDLENPCPALVTSLKHCKLLRALSITVMDHHHHHHLHLHHNNSNMNNNKQSKKIARQLLPALVRTLPLLTELRYRRPLQVGWTTDHEVEDELAWQVLQAKTVGGGNEGGTGEGGWRHVEVSVLGPRTAELLLARHCATLESLRAWTATASSRQLVELLAKSPRLRTFFLPADCHYPSSPFDDGDGDGDGDADGGGLPPFSAEVFVDRDPASQGLRPWLCEAVMQDFSAPIRYDHGHKSPSYYYCFVQNAADDNVDENQPLQELVFERLLRFTQLRGLSLVLGPEGTQNKTRKSLAKAMVTRTAHGAFISSTFDED
ncbi:hypothetical protein DFQ26_006295 [Actinomortierella ambigua]|nr:hypothetical protein DFQ26_006295 [Actinomortierella ambigua]